mmetsp:Transcript_19835/g.62009  ORF Transcript_19835/g.62009 Transcript_19835/m.62009 type:complete len:108 (-) Transcript_19835:195-518(-)
MAAAAPAPAAAEPPVAAELSGPPGLLAWLQANRLEEYHASLLEQGFEELEDLRAATHGEVEQIFDLAGVRPGHMLLFRRALRAGANETGVTAVPGNALCSSSERSKG